MTGSYTNTSSIATWEADKIIEQIKQHHKLNIALFSSNKKYQLSPELYNALLSPHKVYYFFLTFLKTGNTVQSIDFKNYEINPNELLMIFPRQIYCPSIIDKQNTHTKLVFDDTLLAMLPQSFTFLLNPLNKQKLLFCPGAYERIYQSLNNLENILIDDDYKDNTALIISYLNSILIEISHCYYSEKNTTYQTDYQLQQFTQFKMFVEDNLKEQFSITHIANTLNISLNNLYNVVERYADVSPKEYITQRLILEAKRMLFNNNLPVKELAYKLGFNDPNYFSRLFKKYTRKSVIAFRKHFQDLSSY